jgi:hypothetical protein
MRVDNWEGEEGRVKPWEVVVGVELCLESLVSYLWRRVSS